MSWLQKLYETYENNIDQVGIFHGDEGTLLPVAHITIRAQIEVRIDGHGNYKGAANLGEEGQIIVIPATEESAGRSGIDAASCPHPLSDKLQYIAGDYVKYGGNKKSGYQDYINLLQNWCNSPFSNPKVQSVLAYVKKGCLIDDLAHEGLLNLDDNGKLINKWPKQEGKIKTNIAPQDTVIKWVVEVLGEAGGTLCFDKTVFDSWTYYYLSSLEGAGYCQVLACKLPLATKHPKAIYNMAANAKLISANDTSGFTFRGIFDSAAEAYGVSYEATQKAHNALKWLIANQSFARESKVILCWETAYTKNVLPLFDDFKIQDCEQEFIDEKELVLEWDDTIEEPATNGESTRKGVGRIVAKKLIQYVQGYGETPEFSNTIVVMALDSVTDGRFSITYYQEIFPEEFLQRLSRWYSSCRWELLYWKDGKRYFVGSPSPQSIIETTYDGRNIKPKFKIRLYDKLLNCIIDGARIPTDMVFEAVRRTGLYYRNRNVSSYYEDQEFEKKTGVACAMINKYYQDYRVIAEGGFSMTLNKERKTRDYLYGRLLAVAQGLERYALLLQAEKTNGEKESIRTTNADKFMHEFSLRPYTTWQFLHDRLNPYINRLGNKGDMYLLMLDEIHSAFDIEDFTRDTPLEGEYLIGYYCQRKAISETIQALRDKKQSRMEIAEKDKIAGS